MERTGHGLLIAMSVSAPGSGRDRIRRLAFVQGGDTLAVADRPMGGGGRVRYESCGVAFPNSGPVLGPELVWSYSDGRDRVAVSEEVSYVVDLYEGPEKVRSVRRDVPPREVTEAMARRQLGEGMTIGVSGEQRTCATDEVIDQRGVASHLQTVDALRFDPDGRLWVVRGHLEDEEPKIDVFAPDGAYLGTLPAGTTEPLLFLPDGRLVAKTVDELDVERLAVYRVTAN